MTNYDPFLESWEWRAVRMQVLERDGARCACCGRTACDGIVINVDHIKNRKRYPHLALTLSNLQVLCNECNHGKGNRFETDWRNSSPHKDWDDDDEFDREAWLETSYMTELQLVQLGSKLGIAADIGESFDQYRYRLAEIWAQRLRGIAF